MAKYNINCDLINKIKNEISKKDPSISDVDNIFNLLDEIKMKNVHALEMFKKAIAELNRRRSLIHEGNVKSNILEFMKGMKEEMDMISICVNKDSGNV